MITKMGKKAWDFITQGKITDEWFVRYRYRDCKWRYRKS